MRITVRVTPRARHATIQKTGPLEYAISVSVPPERGQATDMARRMLAKHLKVAPSRVSLLMGAHARVKVFEILK